MHKTVNLAYGHTGLPVKFPAASTTVIEPSFIHGLPDQQDAIRTALRNPIGTNPLKNLINSHQTIAISVCDITRAIPTRLILPVILEELAHVPTHQIVILIATGTHRGNTPDELIGMLGDDVVTRYRIENHDAFDRTTLINIGETHPDIPIWLNRTWVQSDIRITVGFVEPHFFAGFSGGPKMVAPGLAGFTTIMRLHDYKMISSPSARWGITDGNPIHDAIRQIATQSKVDFSVDVSINKNREITSVRAGEILSVHRTMCESVKESAMQAFDRPFDVVVTTNSGYPLDQNLYQTVKGLSAAAQVVKEGGTIMCASACADGIPEHGEYKRILKERNSPRALLKMISAPEHNRHDQWEVQIQAQIQQHAQVFLKSDGLTDKEIRAAHMTPIHDISAETERCLQKYGPKARICVLPEGPQTIPYLNKA